MTIRTLLAALLLVAARAHAAPLPVTLHHSGYLLDGADQALDPLAPVPMTFRIFATAGATSALWVGSCAVAVKGGYYAVTLGSDCGAGLDTAIVPPDADRFLEVSVDGVTLAPRLHTAPLPAATLSAQSLDAAALTAALSSPGTLNAVSNPVDWTRLKGVPAGLADGLDADTTYTVASGGGLALVGTELALDGSGCAPGLGLLWNGAAWTCTADTQVAGLRGRPVAAAAPLSGDVLTWTGAAWEPVAPPSAWVAGPGGRLTYGGGNVGVGTTAPASALEVAGTIHSTVGGIRFPDGTTQATAATGSGITAPATALYLRTADNSKCRKLFLDAGGRFTTMAVNCLTLQVSYSLLLHFDGANNSTTFTDSGDNHLAVSVGGGTPVISTAQSVFGGSSLHLNGSSWITVAHHGDFNFGADDYTIDFWMRPTTTGPDESLLMHGSYPQGFGWQVHMNNGAGWATDLMILDAGSSNRVPAPYMRAVPTSGSFNTNQWYHVAWVRSGSTGYVFVNGARVSTVDLTNAPVDPKTIDLVIGYNTLRGNFPFYGYIDELRITKGAGQWTEAFTPPTTPYPW